MNNTLDHINQDLLFTRETTELARAIAKFITTDPLAINLQNLAYKAKAEAILKGDGYYLEQYERIRARINELAIDYVKDELGIDLNSRDDVLRMVGFSPN